MSHIILSTRAEAEQYRADVEAAQGYPRAEGRHFGGGIHVEPEQLVTEHAEDVRQSKDGTLFAYPEPVEVEVEVKGGQQIPRGISVALPDGAEVAEIDATWIAASPVAVKLETEPSDDMPVEDMPVSLPTGKVIAR